MARTKSSEGPQFVRFFGPVLDALRTLGGSGTPDEVAEQIARDLRVPDATQNELLPSGQQRFKNQVAWARFYLVREGLLDSSKRGVWSLTARGRHARLSANEARAVFTKWAKTFQEDRKSRPSNNAEFLETPERGSDTPALNHRTTVLEIMYSLPPNGFEQLCQAILREVGFSEVVVTGRSGDNGIDGHGVLQINSLVSFRVLFQCKRYKGSVSPAQVRDFRGAMAGRADKGIVITTGTFSAEARREATRDGVPPIELIDGEKLVDMLEEYEFGLKKVQTFDVDTQFFDRFRQ